MTLVFLFARDVQLVMEISGGQAVSERNIGCAKAHRHTNRINDGEIKRISSNKYRIHMISFK